VKIGTPKVRKKHKQNIYCSYFFSFSRVNRSGEGGLNVPAADSNACNSGSVYPFCSKFSDFSAILSF